jgi:hypothetical protein
MWLIFAALGAVTSVLLAPLLSATLLCVKQTPGSSAAVDVVQITEVRRGNDGLHVSFEVKNRGKQAMVVLSPRQLMGRIRRRCCEVEVTSDARQIPRFVHYVPEFESVQPGEERRFTSFLSDPTRDLPRCKSIWISLSLALLPSNAPEAFARSQQDEYMYLIMNQRILGASEFEYTDSADGNRKQ